MLVAPTPTAAAGPFSRNLHYKLEIIVYIATVLTVKAINYFKQNRPVHLARRDVYFERAAELIAAQQSSSVCEIKIGDYEEILYLLRVAREHARFAVRDTGSNETDEQFGRFINLIAGNVKAVLSMMTLKNTVESDCSFFSFLGTNEASVGLQAEEYQRRASDIVRSINNTLMLAEEPFERLKVDNIAAATDDEQARYDKAHEHFLMLVQEGKHRTRIASSRKITPF
jgi:hypothetical protein